MSAQPRLTPLEVPRHATVVSARIELAVDEVADVISMLDRGVAAAVAVAVGEEGSALQLVAASHPVAVRRGYRRDEGTGDIGECCSR